MFKSQQPQSKRNTAMVFYLFPRTFFSYDTVSGRFSNHEPFLYSPSLYSYLQELKQKTSDISFFSYNPYIWLYTATLNKTNSSNLCIANIRVNVTGMYELIEMVDLLRMSWDTHPSIRTFHMGPNAFAMNEAIQYIRKKRGQGFRISSDTNDMWINSRHVDVRELYESQKQTFHLITADCTNKEDSEYDSCITALESISISLCTQKHGGTFILKLGDTFSELSLDIIYLLSHFYEKTYFIKPSVNNITSSEKFMVCKGFLFENLDEMILSMLENLYYCTKINQLHLNRIFHDSIPLFFIGKLEEINAIFGQPRLEIMNYILSTTEHNSSRTIYTSKQDIQKCVEWCNKYRVPIHDVWMPWKSV